jgi:transcriptional antiterminator NusG
MTDITDTQNDDEAVDAADEAPVAAEAPVDAETAAAETAEPEAIEAEAAEPEAIEPEAAEAEAIEPDAIDAEDLLDEEAAAAEADDEDDEVAPPESPFDRPGQWFVVHTYAGYENKVKSNLESRIQSMNMEDRIYEVVIPMEDVVELKNNKRVVVQKKVFPGYLLVRMELDDDSWFVVRNTSGVTGFVGLGAKPTPLSRKDVETFLGVQPEGVEQTKKSRPRVEWQVGESVRVKEGPFADFSGTISEIDEDRLKVKVLVNIFGRETPVELEFTQIAKL